MTLKTIIRSFFSAQLSFLRPRTSDSTKCGSADPGTHLFKVGILNVFKVGPRVSFLAYSRNPLRGRRMCTAYALLIITLALSPLSLQASKALNISVTQGKVEPLRIAITDMQGADSYLTQIGKEISNIVANDLESSGMFRPLNKHSFLEKKPIR